MKKWEWNIAHWNGKQKPIAFFALWLIVVGLCWLLIPGWRDQPSGFLILIGAVAIGVMGFLASLKTYLIDLDHTTADTSIAGNVTVATFIARDQWNIYRSVAGRGKLSEEDFQKVLNNYLEWVRNFYSKVCLWDLESLQVTGDRPVCSLTDVFVPLSLCRFTPPRRDEVKELTGKFNNGFERAKAYLRLVEERQKKGQNIDLQKLLISRQRLAVIGGPGCGKSTLLSWLAIHLADTVIGGSPPPFALPDGRKFLLPLIIPLRDYAPYLKRCQESREQALRDAHSGTLYGFIQDYLKKISGMQLSADFFERLLLGGGCLVMLDDLDEVVNREQHAIIRQQVENLVTGYPKNSYLVTARKAGYQQDAVFSDNFLRLDVKRLEDGAISSLVTKWCQQLYPEDVPQSADEIMTAIGEINTHSSDKDLPPLVSTPFMVTMVVSVKFGKTGLPLECAKLYEAAVQVILQAQYTPMDDARKEVVDCDGPWMDQRDWLSLLAYEMQTGGSAGAAISEEQLRVILARILKPDQLNQFIRAVRSRGGLLEERAGLFQFLHLGFQEFLAARRIAKQGDASLLELESHLSDSWWRETLLLTYGFARLDYREFAEKYLTWLSNRKKNDEIRLAGLELAGAALLEIETPDAADQQAQAEKLVTVLQDKEIRAPAIVRARAGDTLARLGDPRPELLTSEAMEFCEVPAGKFRFGEDVDLRTLTLPGFWIGKYPVTVAQFDQFVQAGGYTNPDYWLAAIKGRCWRDSVLFSGREIGFRVTSDDELRTYPVDCGLPFTLPNHPVVGISWYEAVGYTCWLNQYLLRCAENRSGSPWQELVAGQFKVDLPTHEQWQKAARGTDGRIYSWGDDPDPDRANNAESGIGATSAVGCFPGGVSPYGAMDLDGNVREWVSVPRDFRGGSWRTNQIGATWAYRGNDYMYDYRYGSNDIGFRVSLSAAP